LLAEDTIDRGDLEELAEWLRTEPWLTLGPLTHSFERQWAEWLGVDHALFVNSGSSANLLMYYASLCAGRLRNRKVIVPAVAWATTVALAIQLGFEPVMCDAEAETFGPDPGHLEELLQRHEPVAVIVVHVLGVPVNLGAPSAPGALRVPADGGRLRRARLALRRPAGGDVWRPQHVLVLLRSPSVHHRGWHGVHRR
jgi:dTDP-4-amino-4,6-dideoxygalactose transaminase